MKKKYDFVGWATKFGIKCSDGRTIEQSAFTENDGKTVPLVWMHNHNDPTNVLGHALLEKHKDGIKAYGTFNNTEAGELAKKLVEHGDIRALSIYANQLKQNGGNVVHGNIREVSLVLAGANPGASIEFPILAHGEEITDEAIVYSGDGEIRYYEDELEHSDIEKEENEDQQPEEKPEEKNELQESNVESKEEEMKNSLEHADDKTVKEVFDELTEEQKNVVYFMIGQALEDAGVNTDDEEDDEEVKHNVFDGTNEMNGDALSHADQATIISDGKKYGTLKESFLAHAEDYGIDGITWLFPEDRNLNTTPEFLKRDMDWVSAFMGAVHHTPFTRVKSQYADITEDQARAKGYLKGNMKKEEVFSLLKRSTSPQTIYKKQKLDRDDIVDITDFDVVAWLKGEMRMMLNEEIARACLIGDGRLSSDDDKIHEDHVRPIANDADLFTIKTAVTTSAGATEDDKAKAFIRAAIKSRKNYKGSGNPTLFTTEDKLTEMLLLEDELGHALYKTESELATKLRVSKIVTVPVLEGATVGDVPLLGIIVNPVDYNVGADKGGAVEMFDDFDIDFNQYKYLIETRISGALIKPYSAIILFDNTVPESVDGDVEKSKGRGFNGVFGKQAQKPSSQDTTDDTDNG